MVPINGENNGWDSRRTYVLVLISQLITDYTFEILSNTAAANGAIGYTLSYIVSFVVLGIPLVYMELIISQFTARDCIDIWKVRPCLSHIGHIQVIIQILNVILKHTSNTFTFHYLIVSFESPIPYYTCGHWSTKNCNMIKRNYTINTDCFRKNQKIEPYCYLLYKTLPEFQYWQRNVLGLELKIFYVVAWRVYMASALVCLLTYFSLFKRKTSLSWVVGVFAFYPLAGYALLLMGSMLQKGIVKMYSTLLDYSFTEFGKNFRLSMIINQMVINLGLGSGFVLNLGAKTGFRDPCYANVVIAVAVCLAATALVIFTTAIMVCPYAYTYDLSPLTVLKYPFFYTYEKIPKFLSQYQKRLLWLIIAFSSNFVAGLSTNIIFIFHLLETLAIRRKKVARYAGLTAFFTVTGLYIITLPLLSRVGITVITATQHYYGSIMTFLVILEIFVFIFWYGMGKFSEDVHFMQGIQPKKYMKTGWVLSAVLLSYSFCYELYLIDFTFVGVGLNDILAWCVFFTSFGLIVLVTLGKIVTAVFRKKTNEMLCLDPAWGPKNDVLQRSRAMFTAQAMTKEYLYRQYHLQAGILQRQSISNCRT